MLLVRHSLRAQLFRRPHLINPPSGTQVGSWQHDSRIQGVIRMGNVPNLCVLFETISILSLQR